MQLLVCGDGAIECPICSLVLTLIKHRYQVAVEAVHKPYQCPWSEWKFRVNLLTGQAERIKEKAA
jgi:hypothetical protein